MHEIAIDQSALYLNRNSATPLYFQLKEYIKEAILKGQYKPNDRLPTEEELCKMFSVSRPVVRQAYGLLIREGLIERQKGSGTFVKQKANRSSIFTEFVTFSLEENIVDLQKNSKIIRLEKIVDQKINQRMGLPAECESIHIIRLVHEFEYPISMIETYLSCKYFKNFEYNFTAISLRPILDIVESVYGIYIQRINRELNPIQVTQEKAMFLHGEENDLAYEIETKYVDGFERTVLLEYATYLASNVSFNVEIGKNKKNTAK